jgi:hypothetical protein
MHSLQQATERGLVLVDFDPDGGCARLDFQPFERAADRYGDGGIAGMLGGFGGTSARPKKRRSGLGEGHIRQGRWKQDTRSHSSSTTFATK